MKSSNKPTGEDGFILIGRVTGAHGIRGELKIHSYAESLDLYRVGGGMRLNLPDGSVRTPTVLRVTPHGRGLRLELESVTDRTQAESLVGASIFVETAALPPLDDETFYWFELMGLTVYDTAGRLLGCLEEVIPTPANDVYVVRGTVDGQARETLIPAVVDVVRSVDRKRRTMIVDPPEGL